ncbi:unnamed protein product [Owenia fusiformis]|uniref:Reverse transcriptase zinc-binding domain-containing protein n=1 Tax=Owenia fusiformis TaxID=6347 RepID=A0A8S4MYW4_OWEFU|nr:unnamed protein product [Owenia fusiformis]
MLNISRNEETLINRFRVDLLFRAQLFAHNYTFISSPNCSCGLPETPKHFFFHCPLNENARTIFFNTLYTETPLIPTNQSTLLEYLAFSNHNFSNIRMKTQKSLL